MSSNRVRYEPAVHQSQPASLQAGDVLAPRKGKNTRGLNLQMMSLFPTNFLLLTVQIASFPGALFPAPHTPPLVREESKRQQLRKHCSLLKSPALLLTPGWVISLSPLCVRESGGCKLGQGSFPGFYDSWGIKVMVGEVLEKQKIKFLTLCLEWQQSGIPFHFLNWDFCFTYVGFSSWVFSA